MMFSEMTLPQTIHLILQSSIHLCLTNPEVVSIATEKVRSWIQSHPGTKIISVDQSVKSERALFNAVQKLAGLLFTFVQAFAYVLFGMYGPVSELGFSAILIILQLCVAGVIITILVCIYS